MEDTLAYSPSIHKPSTVDDKTRAATAAKQLPNLVFLPLCIGIGLYALTSSGQILSGSAITPDYFLPRWILYGLSHGLVVFALLNSYQLVWKNPSYGQVLFWITAITAAAIATACGRGLHIADILFYELAYTISTYHYFIKNLALILN
jgi:hypothetical protein